VRQKKDKIDEGQQKIKIVRTNRQSNLRGSCQSIFSLCSRYYGTKKKVDGGQRIAFGFVSIFLHCRHQTTRGLMQQTGEEEEEVVFEPDEEYSARSPPSQASPKPSRLAKGVGFIEAEIKKEPRSSRLHTKYDFIKVKVWLEDHYYILSRFIVSRMLTLIKVNWGITTKIDSPSNHQHFLCQREA